MATEIKFGTDGWRGVIAGDYTFDNVRHLIELKTDPLRLGKAPWKSVRALPTVWHMRCRRILSRAALAASRSVPV